jgi:diguanylate cyclase (GGDEF)-like protein
LVVDVEEVYLIASDILAEISGQSYDVTWKKSFDAALAAIDQEVFDVLVFDYRLGAETGLDLLRAVNQRAYPAPVILLTGQHDDEIDSEAIRLGALDYLIKGRITPDSFERSIRHAIEHFRVLVKLRSSNAFLQSIIDALSAEVAILNTQEEILAVNQAWRNSFEGDHPTEYDSGDQRSGFTLKGHSPVGGDIDPEAVILGVRQVIRGEIESFYLEYPCVTAGRSRWVIARVSKFLAAGEGYVVVAYEDITTRKLAELSLEQSRAMLEELSIRDELTRLYNRRYISQFLQEEFERSQRYGHAFALLMLDIDHFKSVNDTYGHGIGDNALVHVARLCMESCRTTDRVARYGGEEIVFVLPETRWEDAIQFAERVRVLLQMTPLMVVCEDGRPLHLQVTASIGVAAYPNSGDSVESLFTMADKGLYRAKADGRNCVHFVMD